MRDWNVSFGLLTIPVTKMDYRVVKRVTKMPLLVTEWKEMLDLTSFPRSRQWTETDTTTLLILLHLLLVVWIHGRRRRWRRVLPWFPKTPWLVGGSDYDPNSTIPYFLANHDLKVPSSLSTLLPKSVIVASRVVFSVVRREFWPVKRAISWAWASTRLFKSAITSVLQNTHTTRVHTPAFTAFSSVSFCSFNNFMSPRRLFSLVRKCLSFSSKYDMSTLQCADVPRKMRLVSAMFSSPSCISTSSMLSHTLSISVSFAQSRWSVVFLSPTPWSRDSLSLYRYHITNTHHHAYHQAKRLVWPEYTLSSLQKTREREWCPIYVVKW